MMHKRILAAATAAVLALGMSMGGAGAALATEFIDSSVVQSSSLESSRVVDSGEGGGGGGGTGVRRCNDEPGFTLGTKYEIGKGGVDVSGSRTFDWGTLSWTAQQLIFTAKPGWTVDLCVKGGSEEMNSVSPGTGTVTINRVQAISHFMWVDPRFTAPVATAAITVVPANCFSGTTISGAVVGTVLATFGPVTPNGNETSSIVATATAPALFAQGEFDPADGVVNEDRTTKTFTVATNPELPGDDPLCVRGLASVEVSFVAPECDTPELLTVTVSDLVNARVKAGSLVQGDGTFVVTFEMTTPGVFDTNKQATEFAKDGRALTVSYSEDFRELTLSGSLAGPIPGDDPLCVSPVATALITVVPANCFSGTTISGAVVGTVLATFGPVTPNGNETSSIVATATAPALFAQGEFDPADGVVNEDRTTKTFTVATNPELPGDDPLCVRGLASVEVSFVAPECDTPELLTVTVSDLVNARVKAGSLVQGDGTFVVTFEMTTPGVFDTNKQATEFAKDGRALTVSYSEDFRELTLSGSLAGPTRVCFDPPSLANWPASAVATPQICTPSGPRSGAITVQLSTGPAGNENPVRYYLAFGTAEQRELTSATTAVPTGAYTVTAETSDSADSVNNEGNTATFAVVVGAPAGGTCDLPTLAFTGASELTGVAGLIALLLTLTGVAMLAAQRRARV
jgi:hypothetical protein